MKIHQFVDSGLAHFSYAVISEGDMAVIDPTRNPQPYYDLAEQEGARITTVIETHPHADFVSSHAEIAATTGAMIYVSGRIKPEYSFRNVNDGDLVKLGEIWLRILETNGHSPDSISIVAVDEKGKDQAVFTGDTLMIGDVGRPDLRENGVEAETDRRKLAVEMYHTLYDKLLKLDDDVVVYPAHGGGSLCSRTASSSIQSTIGAEKRNNPSLKPMDEADFVDYLVAGQPFVPKYFSYNVRMNRKGAPAFEPSIAAVPSLASSGQIPIKALIIDTRPAANFNRGHLDGAINLMLGDKFETWLGSIIEPAEGFYIVAANKHMASIALEKAAKIGYELFAKGIYTGPIPAEGIRQTMPLTENSPENFTVVDVRNPSEIQNLPLFENSIRIPLYEIRERWREVPQTKPIIVHCAAGYRSAAASSILARFIKSVPIYDAGESIAELLKEAKTKQAVA